MTDVKQNNKQKHHYHIPSTHTEPPISTPKLLRTSPLYNAADRKSKSKQPTVTKSFTPNHTTTTPSTATPSTPSPVTFTKPNNATTKRANVVTPPPLPPAVRKPRRKAVVVGINYSLCGPIRLKGCVNDAHSFALALVNLFDFHPSNILLLTDELPQDNVFLSNDDITQIKQGGTPFDLQRSFPERTHLMLGIKWLIAGAQPGDTLVFYFAGHGLQLDNMSGWEGEGYDEAILPLDCAHASGEVNAITTVSIRQLLLSVDDRVQVAVFVDCNGAQTMMDVSGTGKWTYIKGVMQRGWWPFVTDPTDKMHRAKYNDSVWTDPSMRSKDVRPRFVPGVEVGNVLDLADAMPGQKNFGNTTSKAYGYLFASAPFGSVAIEGLTPGMTMNTVTADGKICKDTLLHSGKYLYHGAFTWALIRTLNEAVIQSCRIHKGDKKIPFKTIEIGIRNHIQALKQKRGFPYLDQEPELTFYVSSGTDPNDYMFYPFSGRAKGMKYIDATPENMKKRTTTWVPNRSEFLNAWQAESALSYYGYSMGQNKPSYLHMRNEFDAKWKNKFKDKLFGYSQLVKQHEEEQQHQQQCRSRLSPIHSVTMKE